MTININFMITWLICFTWHYCLILQIKTFTIIVPIRILISWKCHQVKIILKFISFNMKSKLLRN